MFINEINSFLFSNIQIPDVKTGNERVDAVVVDEESVGPLNSRGCGGKILRGDGALERYLAEIKLKESQVPFFQIWLSFLEAK